MSLSVDSLSVDAACVEQLRSVFWSMRKVVDAAQREGVAGRALLFELGSLAALGVTLADCAIEHARKD